MTRIVIAEQAGGHVVSPLLFGQFIEHMGGCIYDGIWVGLESGIANEDGLRLDTLEALRALEIPVLRWPGGLWADTYDWRDGIGPRGQRPVRQNLGWNTVESNAFGTHEYMRLCRLIGAEPFICVNMGSGTVALARDWAEYCNSAVDTTLTRQRAANGDARPFGVKFWGLGNEPFYTLDGRMRNVYYADLARNYAGYLKHMASQCPMATDPGYHDVKLIWAVRDDEAFEKNVRAEPTANELVDMLSIHFYAGRPKLPEKPMAPEAWRMLEYQNSIGALDRLQALIESAGACAQRLSSPQHRCRVAVDEWSTWYRSATPQNEMVQPITLGDALFAAGTLHVLMRNEVVAMANMTQAVNILMALIRTKGPAFVKTAVYYVWEMLKGHKGQVLMPVEVEGAARVTVDTGEGLAERAGLSVAATRCEKTGTVRVSLVNFAEEEGQRVRLELAGRWKVGAGRVLTGARLFAENSFAEPEAVAPRGWEVTGLEEVVVPARCVAMVELRPE